MAEAGAVAVRRLVPDDAAALAALRREALEREPLAFASSPEEDWYVAPEPVRERLAAGGDAAVFGAFGPELLGSVGIGRIERRKRRHSAHLWGLYVRADARGAGAGRALVQAAVAFARQLGVAQVLLSVSETAGPARRLYESLGFRRWGTEPDALRHGGASSDEHHMVLRLA